MYSVSTTITFTVNGTDNWSGIEDLSLGLVSPKSEYYNVTMNFVQGFTDDGVWSGVFQFNFSSSQGISQLFLISQIFRNLDS
jgi:hypothetical protein